MAFNSLARAVYFPLIILFAYHPNVFGQHPLPAIEANIVFNKLVNYANINALPTFTINKDTGNNHIFSNAVLPPAIALEMPTPGDQGLQRSCGAWAVVYGAGNYYNHLKTGLPYNDSNNLNPGFIYNQLSKGRCGITSLMDNLDLFKEMGACSLKTMPFTVNDCATQPDSLQHLEAKRYKINGWEKLSSFNINVIKQSLWEQKPVIFSIAIDEGFDQIKAPYIWNERCGRLEQTHTMLLTGYDDKKNAFLVINSWGTHWGDKGFIWIDYQFFLRNALHDLYILK